MPATGTQYDFGAPFLAARIIDANENKFPLWIDSSPDFRFGVFSSVSGGPDLGQVSQLSMPWVQSIEVRLGLGFVPTIRATLTPPFEEGIMFLDSPLIEWSVSRLEVQFGYTGGPQKFVLSPPFSGILLKPDVDVGQDITITLNAQGVSGFSLIRQTGGRTFVDESRLSIIKKLVSGADPENPRKAEVDDEDIRKLSGTGQKLKAAELLDQKVSFAQGTMTDWFAIYALATEAKCWILGTGSVLRIIPRETVMTGVPSKSFVFRNFGSEIGPSVGIYPILSASSPTSAIYMPGSMRGIALRDVDPVTRKPVTRVATDANQANPRVGDSKGDSAAPVPSETYPDINQEDGSNAWPYPGNPTNPQVEAAANAEFEKQSTMMGVHIEVETLGVPDLIPGELIRIDGLGARLRGVYSVFEVTHTVGTDGFSTKFTAVSNTAKMLEKGFGVAGNINTSKASPPEEAQTLVANPKTGQGSSSPGTVSGR